MSQQHDSGVRAVETVTGHTPGNADSLIVTEAPKKRRRYSRGLRASQEVERGVSNAAATISDGLAETFKIYKKRSRNSSEKKRDGAIRDAVKNWAKAYGEGMKAASNAPYEFVKTIDRGKTSRQIRDAVKMFSPPMFR